MRPAARLDQVLRPVIPELAALVRQTPGTLSLAQGMVGWAPPATVREQLAAALLEPGPALDHYGAVAGDTELLAAVAAAMAAEGLDLEGADLWVTAGSNMAFQAIAQVICEGPPQAASEVILPLPYYFNHVMAVQLAGGVPVPVEAGLIPDPQRLAAAITPRTRAIVTISPNNPSGVVMPRAVLAAINQLCARHGLLHISDEAYGAFVHGDEPHWSPAAQAGAAAHTVTLQSLSKAYGMAGWRVGFMAVPASLSDALAKVQDTALICPPRLVQRAALAALAAGASWCQPRIAALGERRRQLLEAVAAARAAGLPLRLLAEPDGAFYGLLALEAGTGQGLSGRQLMQRLVQEHRVAAVCGESFGLGGPVWGPVLRLSYGLLGPGELAEALQRLFGGVRALLADAPP